MSSQSGRMLFQRSLFSGISNLPKSTVLPSSLQVGRRAKTGFGGKALTNPTDHDVKSESLRNRKGITKDTSGFVKDTVNRTSVTSNIQKVAIGQQRKPGFGSTKEQKEPFLPFSHFLTDLHGREHDYLRISISERCWTTMPIVRMIPTMLYMMRIFMILHLGKRCQRCWSWSPWSYLLASPPFHWVDVWSARHLSCIWVEGLHRYVFLCYPTHPPSSLCCYITAVLIVAPKLGQSFYHPSSTEGL